MAGRSNMLPPYEVSPPKRYAQQFQQRHGLRLKGLWKDYKLPEGHSVQTFENEILNRFQTNSSTWVERNYLRRLVGGNFYTMRHSRKEIPYGEGLDRAMEGMREIAYELVSLNPKLGHFPIEHYRGRNLFHFLWGVSSQFNVADIYNFIHMDVENEDVRERKQARLELQTGIKFDWLCSMRTLNTVAIAASCIDQGNAAVRLKLQRAARQMADIMQI
jgi:hypothetical protein